MSSGKKKRSGGRKKKRKNSGERRKKRKNGGRKKSKGFFPTKFFSVEDFLIILAN